MKQLEIDWPELEMAFETQSWEMSFFLDKETGRVLTVTEEANRQLERIVEETYDPDAPDDFDLEAALAQANIQDWQKEEVRNADLVETGYGSHIIAIPQRTSYEAYDEMQDFISTIQDDGLYNRLQEATRGRGAFGRFKGILGKHPAEEQRWYAFQANRLRQQILVWLADEGIEPITVPEPAEVKMEDMLELRHKLLDEVLIFMQAASHLPGIIRIALIGSLTTEKPDPKDADMLVTVIDNADLTQLATVARKLQGHAQSFGRNGEVFLADSQHHYLGHTCPWKRCGPGIRASCEAWNCGRHLFLYDDLDNVKLAEKVIAEPPVELWPQVITRVPVPDDLMERVIRPLQKEL